MATIIVIILLSGPVIGLESRCRGTLRRRGCWSREHKATGWLERRRLWVEAREQTQGA